MKAIMSKVLVGLLLAAALAGCASTVPSPQQESAIQWMEHQSDNVAADD